MNLKHTMLGSKIQTVTIVRPLTWTIRNREMQRRPGASGEGGSGGNCLTLQGLGLGLRFGFWWWGTKMFWNKTEVVVAAQCECTKCH